MTTLAAKRLHLPASLGGKPARVLLCFVLLAVLAQLLPWPAVLHWWPTDPWSLVPRLFRPSSTEAETPPTMGPGAGGGATQIDDAAVLAALPAAGLADRPSPVAARPAAISGIPNMALEDPGGALGPFWAALDRTAAKRPGAVTRILHYGDSLIMGDFVTQTVRRLMQKRFGDAGHGFVLAGKPSSWYRRDHLRLDVSDGWDQNRITSPFIGDRAYGLGGATFRTRKAGATIRLEPEARDGLGGALSHVEVSYWAQPAGGAFEVQVGPRREVVETRSVHPEARVLAIDVPEGPHVVRLQTSGTGEVRLFGFVIERAGPGVAYDSLGLNGARARLLAQFGEEHWFDQIRRRHADLLVLHYGANETQDKELSYDRYRGELTARVAALRHGLPELPCLLVAPMDRVDRDASGNFVTRPVVKRIVAVQRQVAAAQGCAFYDTWKAMGGEGAMGRWYKARPQLGGGDLTHPTALGADRIGAMIFVSLMDGYAHRRTASLTTAGGSSGGAP